MSGEPTNIDWIKVNTALDRVIVAYGKWDKRPWRKETPTLHRFVYKQEV